MVVIYDKEQLNGLKNTKGDTILYIEGNSIKIVKSYQRKGTLLKKAIRVSIKSNLKSLVSILKYTYGYDIEYKEKEK